MESNVNQSRYRGSQREDWSTGTRPFCTFPALNFHSLKYNDTPFNLAFTQFIPLHYNLMQGHWKVRVRGSTATSKPHAGRKRDLKKKVSIFLLQLIVLSSVSWLYTTKEIQTISYRCAIASVLPKHDISSCHLCFSPCWQSFQSSAELPQRAMYTHS